MKARLFTDGGARSNPGQAAIGVVLEDADGRLLGEIARTIGTDSNNGAEYAALIQGLKFALDQGVREIEVRVDSPIVAGHLLGSSRVKSERLRHRFDEVKDLLGRFEKCDIARVPRGENTAADRLVNQAFAEGKAAMFTINLDVSAATASVTCAKCLGSSEFMWSDERGRSQAGAELWGWADEHTRQCPRRP